MLLLDEPTNHLDASSVAWLESFLAAYKGNVIRSLNPNPKASSQRLTALP